MDWQTWIQNVGSEYLNARTMAKYQQPYEIQKMQLQAYGPQGQVYNEGMPTNTGATVAGIPTSVLLLAGAALIAVVLIKD